MKTILNANIIVKKTSQPSGCSILAALSVGLAMALGVPASAYATLTVNQTFSGSVLGGALNPTGLTITSANIVNGADGQFGTYSGFTAGPVTIGDGIVLSSGLATQTVAPADPNVSSPTKNNNDMGVAGTSEFDLYGTTHIQNFSGSFDVAALQVTFFLSADSQVKFDFVFGSVEYPYWTSQYTDSMLVFLDGTGSANQVTFDKNGVPVQVGASFAGLQTTADQNSAFASPHGLLPKLTTTTSMLTAGSHTLRFEVGDVNDHILDSAAFISNLRTGSGATGTDIESEAVPEPSTCVTGALMILPFGMQALRSLRRRKTAAPRVG